MFFIVGFLVGVFYGVVAQLATGLPILFARGFGLLWGDRRLWWTATLFLAIAIGLYVSSSAHKHREFTESLQKGFIGMQNTGVMVGAIFVWLIGVLILIKLGAGWKAPMAVSPAISVVVLIALVLSTVGLHRLPQKHRDVRNENLSRWEKAIQEKDLATASSLVDSGAKFWGPSDGLPGGPVIFCVNRGDTQFLIELLALHPQPSFIVDAAVRRAAETRNRETLAALFSAYPETRPALVSAAVSVSIRLGDRDLYDWLFAEHGADPNQLAIKGASHLMNAARQGNVEIAADLLERGAKLEYLHPGGRYSAETALGAAVHLGHLEVLKFLIEQGADPDGRSDDGFSPLMRAVDQKQPEVIPTLLAAGADPNLTNENGDTALHLATSGHRPDFEVAAMLLEAGADPSLTNKKGFRPESRLPQVGGDESN